MKYKRFMLFVYRRFALMGGLDDSVGSFDTLEEAIKKADTYNVDYKEILDLQEREIVWPE